MRCEDYPCCGHTDGLGCDWTYTAEARAYDEAHMFCEHEHGFCEVEDDYDEDDVAEYADYYRDGMEDAWLDGSYEE